MPEQVAALKTGPDVLILCNPANPTGSLYKEDTLAQLYQALSARDGVLIVDEIMKGFPMGEHCVLPLV